MSFKRLEERVSPAVALPVTIMVGGNGALPRLMIGVGKSISAELADDPWKRCYLLIGEYEDAGKIVLDRDDVLGPITVNHKKRGGFMIDCGHVPDVSPTAIARTRVAARMLDGHQIEITLPEFEIAEAGDEETDDESGEGEQDSDAEDDDADDDSVAQPPVPGGVDPNVFYVDLAADNETVSFHGLTAEITARQAKLLYLLGRQRPMVVPKRLVINGLWDGNPPTTASDVLETMLKDLVPILEPMKLMIKPKADGYQLVDL